VLAGYESDEFFTGVKTFFTGGEANGRGTRDYSNQFFVTEDGLVYEKRGRQPRLCIPADTKLRVEIMHERHDAPIAGHFGVDKTVASIHRNYWWPHLRRDVGRYVASCESCQRNKPSQQSPAGLLQPLPVPENRWEDITMDYIVQLPATPRGYDAILVVVDRMTKCAHFIPTTTNVTAAGTARLFVDNIFRLHGLPKSIVHDRDPRFVGKFWRSLFDLLGVKLRPSTAFHPQTDGQTERTNRTLEQMLRNYVSYKQDDWDQYLSLVEFAYNSAEQASIGMSPFYCDLGRQPTTADILTTPQGFEDQTNVDATATFLGRMNEILQTARSKMTEAQERQAKYANRCRRDETFRIGDEVWLSAGNINADINKQRPTKKLSSRFLGPFRIGAVISTTAYRLDLPDSLKIHPVFHVSQLKRYTPSPGEFQREQQSRPAPEIVDDAEEFEVEYILDKRVRRRRTEYLVKWRGYHPDEATWLPTSELPNAKEAIRTFEKMLAGTARS
jgi:hypothetical protein